MPAACPSRCRPAASTSSSIAGVDTYGAAEFRPLARATAAHSTATLNDTSSARFNHSIRVNDLDSPPLIGGPAARAVPAYRPAGNARLHRQP